MDRSIGKFGLQKLIGNYETEVKILKQTVEKYFRIFYMSPNAVGLVREDGTFAEINPSFTLITGFAKEETLGKTMQDLGVWFNINDREKILKMLAGSNKVQKIELPLYKKNGEIIHAQLLLRKVFLHEHFFYMVVGQDISKQVAIEAMQRKQEEELLISRNKLSTAATLANIGPWEYDAKREQFDFCDEFYAILGTNLVREGRFMGFDEYMREFVHPDDFWMFADEKVLLSPPEQENSLPPADIIHRIIKRDGAVRTVIVRRRFIRDPDGNLIKACGTTQDITEQILIEEKQRKQAEIIEQMAYYDSLTGLPNKNNLYKWLTEQMAQSKAGNLEGIVLFIDLDQLKMFNDAYGHNFGDRIIVTASRRILEVMDKKAFLARIGGDKFVIVLLGKYHNGQVKVVANKIINALGKKQEHLETGIHITASIGIAHYPKDGDTADEIIKNAENAMYKAKKHGKNCWGFYDESMQIEARKEIRMIEGLRAAIKLGELSLVYQPQIVFPQKTVGGVEALLRWDSHEFGNVSPAKFIPLAEQSDLINSIGKWAMTKVCSFAGRLAKSGSDNIRVAVNISARQVVSEDFVKTISNAIKSAGIEPKQLEIELTESLLMTSLEDAISKLNKVKEMGVNLALDDFGTGYSSLTYLRKLPVGIIKIDKSFIDMIETDDLGAKMIVAIINMAKAINLTVVAEGVETEKQMEYLLNEGCTNIQGYLLCKPLQEDEVYKFIQHYNKGL
jgi:diguanylate cyclase (GGDEF)-like protein/PAS domain S-box-containing protein